MIRAVLLAACCGLSACGANKYCLAPQDYQAAEVVPELRPAGGLDLPESPSALRLPPAPTHRTPFGTRVADGEAACLDQPPQMPPVVSPDEEGAGTGSS